MADELGRQPQPTLYDEKPSSRASWILWFDQLRMKVNETIMENRKLKKEIEDLKIEIAKLQGV